MTEASAVLGRSITRASSKQSYFTARLLADGDLVDDCLRAYAYFRWADDIVDVSAQSVDERVAFIRRQVELIDRLYSNERPDDLSAEEQILADLIRSDRTEHSGLESFIRNFMSILEFDSRRKGQLITDQDLTWYASCLGKAVTDAIQYFVGNGHPYPDTENRYLAATGATIAHMLRDMVSDVAEGYINIPREYLEAHTINHEDVGSAPFRDWVRGRVDQARLYFREGKRYLDELGVLRCKIAGYWYCARFEGVLDTIERDGYVLRESYAERRKLITWLKIAWLGLTVTARHITGLGRSEP